MKAELTKSGCTLTRETGDPRISHESTVGYKMKKLLNSQFYSKPCNEPHCGAFGDSHLVPYRFVRMNPSKHGLNSCRVGLIDHKAGIMLWHERYAIENAATEFNSGKVFFQRVDVTCDYCGKADCHFDCDESQAGGF